MSNITVEGYVSYYPDNELYSSYKQTQVWLGVLLKKKGRNLYPYVENYDVVKEIVFKTGINLFNDLAVDMFDEYNHKYKECHISKENNKSVLYYKDRFYKNIDDEYVVVPYREFYYDKIQEIISSQASNDGSGLSAQDISHLIDLYIDTKTKEVIAKEHELEKERKARTY